MLENVTWMCCPSCRSSSFKEYFASRDHILLAIIASKRTGEHMARLFSTINQLSARMPRCGVRCVHALPAGFFALVLFVEPLFERRKIVEDCRCVHLALPADG